MVGDRLAPGKMNLGLGLYWQPSNPGIDVNGWQVLPVAHSVLPVQS
jgi:hypothetical protein